MTIVNLTQHLATPEQHLAGVVDLSPTLRAELQRLLTFDFMPSSQEVEDRASRIVALVADTLHGEALIGGAPYLMPHLERALRELLIVPLYSFTARVSTEEPQPDGSVQKTNTFRHLGFVVGSVNR